MPRVRNELRPKPTTMTLICGTVRLTRPSTSVESKQRDDQRGRGADAEHEALRHDVDEGFDVGVAEQGVSRGLPSEGIEQGFGQDAVAADADEHSHREEVE